VDSSYVGAYSTYVVESSISAGGSSQETDVANEDDISLSTAQKEKKETETTTSANVASTDTKTSEKKSSVKASSVTNDATEDTHIDTAYTPITADEPVYQVTEYMKAYGKSVSSTGAAQKDPSYSQAEFIEKVGCIAVSYWDEYQLLPSVTIAQAIIESGWGKSTLASTYHNYFGIKYSSSAGTDYVSMKTGEQKKSGEYYTITAKFRAYNSMEEGIADRYEFLSTNKRYQSLIGVTDYAEECRLLQSCGYATSLTYAQTLIDTIESYGLQQYDEQALSQ
jgi:lysozyme